MLGIDDGTAQEKAGEEHEPGVMETREEPPAVMDAEASDSDDDEPILRRKPTKKRFNRSLLDDSDEEGETNTAADSTTDKVEPDPTDSENDEDNKENTPVGPHKSRIRVLSDDEDSNSERIPLAAVTKPSLFRSDMFDAEMDDSNSAISQKTDDSNEAPKQFQKTTGDESDSDEDSGSSGDSDSNSGSSSSDNEDDPFKKLDEQYGENEEDPIISEALRRKLAKGAAKKEKGRSSQSSRPTKSDTDQIHSETQRIVRESAVSLPYHQPQRIGLSVFLARSQQKQAQLQKALKTQPNCTWKTAPDLASQPSLQEFLPKTTETPPADTDASDEVKEDDPVSNNGGTATNCDTMETNEMTLENQPEKETESNQNSEVMQEIDEADLPDLIVESDKPGTCHSETVSMDQEPSESAVSDKFSETTPTEAPMTENVESEKTSKDDCDTLPDILPGEDKSNSKSGAVDNGDELPDLASRLQHKGAQALSSNKPEQDSGFLTGPCSEEENSGDLPGAAVTETQIVNPTTPNQKSKSKTFMTPKLAGLGLDRVQPKLSGAPHDFIDFDIDVDVAPPSKKVTGVHNLMERLTKHSARRRSKAKDIELSVIHKDRVGDTDKEELRLEKVVVHIDAEEMKEPELEKPGAKLSLLKQRLSTQMKKRRADIREQQKEIFEMDNEEGFLDEDAELTDQTDTDVEDEEEDEEGEDEEGDEEEDEDFDEEDELRQKEKKKKKKKKKSKFVHEEAEDDEEDEDYEEGDEEEEMDEDDMNLQLDLGEDEESNDTASIATTQSPQKAVRPQPQKVAAPRLQKTQTLELFDDDAMSESPVSTQEVSSMQDASSQGANLDRPFERLSQNKSTDDIDGFDGISGDQPKDNNCSGSLPLGDRDLSLQSGDTSYSDMIPAGQPMRSKSTMSLGDEQSTPDVYTPSSKSSVTTHSKNRSRGNDLHLLIEDSQDLLSGQLSPTRQGSSSSYFDDESHSLMLDADGFVREKSRQQKSVRKQLKLDITSNSMQSSLSDTQDELMGLCSGNFSTGNKGDAHKTLFGGVSPAVGDTAPIDELFGLCSGRFTQKEGQEELPLSLCSGRFTQKKDKKEPLIQQTQGGGLDELMGLCSGKFTSASPISKKGVKRKPTVEDDEDDDEVKSTGSFVVDDADVEDEGDDAEHGFSSDEEGDRDDDEDEEDEEVQLAKQMFKSFKGKNKKLRNAFVEEEAELSGSEAESDEDLDLAEEDDYLEKEAGDDEDLPSDEELRNQVNRVHMKTLIDEDKRELRLMQEMYLADGDLHSDGSGRIRRFRWRNADDEDTQQDMFRNSDEEEAEDEETELESKWRAERFEREKFLQEQKENKEEEPEQSESQLLKLGKVVLKPKLKRGMTYPVVSPKSKQAEKPASQQSGKNIFKVPSRHGSFLKRGKESLAKIAELTRPSGNLGGARSGGNFVFTAHNKEEGDDESNADGKRKAHVPKPAVRRSSSVPSSQPAKKPRLEKSSTMPKDSIFNLF